MMTRLAVISTKRVVTVVLSCGWMITLLWETRSVVTMEQEVFANRTRDPRTYFASQGGICTKEFVTNSSTTKAPVVK